MTRRNERPPAPAPQADDITDCWRCGGGGCGHCNQTGKLRWIAYGRSEPFVKVQEGITKADIEFANSQLPMTSDR